MSKNRKPTESTEVCPAAEAQEEGAKGFGRAEDFNRINGEDMSNDLPKEPQEKSADNIIEIEGKIIGAAEQVGIQKTRDKKFKSHKRKGEPAAADTLTEIEGEESGTAEAEDKPKKRKRKKFSKKKKIIFIAAAVLLAIVIGVGIAVYFLFFGGLTGGGSQNGGGRPKPPKPSEQVDLTTETEGLSYVLNDSGTGYICTGVGEAENLVALVLPTKHENLPVTEIADYAFNGCKSLKYAVLPDCLEKVGGEAFRHTPLHATETNWENGALYLGKHLIEVRPEAAGEFTVKEGTRTVAGEAFRACVDVTFVKLPEGLVSIGGSAFLNCTGLTGVEIPQSCKWIGAGAFAFCSSLKRAAIPEGVTEIGDFTFRRCGALESVQIPNSVQSVGTRAFAYCLNLAEVSFGEKFTSVGRYSFVGCAKLARVTLPNGLKSIGYGAFEGCAIDRVSLPEGVQSLGERAFAACTNLKFAVLPQSLAEAGAEAFADCVMLESIFLAADEVPAGWSAEWRKQCSANVYFKGEWDYLEGVPVIKPQT